MLTVNPVWSFRSSPSRLGLHASNGGYKALFFRSCRRGNTDRWRSSMEGGGGGENFPHPSGKNTRKGKEYTMFFTHAFLELVTLFVGMN